MLECCVAIRSKMLTYYRVRSAFESNPALPSSIIWAFEITSYLHFLKSFFDVLNSVKSLRCKIWQQIRF